MSKNKTHIWCIAYIDKELIKNVQKDLKHPEYRDVDVFIPTVKVLKKTFKGKESFDEVPLLFNYGFFKIPRAYAASSRFLENMKENIGCIFSWLNDPGKIYVSYTTMDGMEIRTNNVPIATVEDKEIEALMDKSIDYSIHSAEDVELMHPGMLITLRGYPFDEMQAEIISIDAHRKKMKVYLVLFESRQEVEVSFDNVFFTIYHDNRHDDSLSTIQSLDELQDKNKLDKKLYKNESH